MLLICTHAEMLHICTLRSLYSPLLRVKNDQLYDYNDYFTLRAFSVFRLQRKKAQLGLLSIAKIRTTKHELMLESMYDNTFTERVTSPGRATNQSRKKHMEKD